MRMPPDTAAHALQCQGGGVRPSAREASARLKDAPDASRRMLESCAAGEVGLRDAEERYRIIAEFSPDWDFWLNADGRYEYVSPACEEICGYSAQEFLADARFMERVLHPDDLPRWLQHWDEIIDDGDAGQPGVHHHHAPAELRIVRSDGSIRWIEHQCRPVFGTDGRYRGRRGVNRDITERKAAEERAARLTRLYGILSGVNQSIARAESTEQLLARVTRVAVSLGGFAAVAVTMKDGTTGAARLVAQTGLLSPAVAEIPWATLECGEPVVVRASSAAVSIGVRRAGPDAAVQGSGGDLSVCHLSLSQRGRSIGALSIFSRNPHAFAEDVLDLLSQLACDLSYAIELFTEKARRRKAEEALRENEARYRRIVETTHEGVWTLAPDLRLTHVNEAMARMLGYSRKEMLGCSVLDFMFPDDHADQLQRMACQTGECTESYERRLRCKDGSEALVRIAATPLVDAQGELEGAFAVVSNITLLRQAGDAIKHNLLLRGLFERSPVAMVLLHGPEHRVQMVNAEFTRRLGYTLEEMQDARQFWRRVYPRHNGRRQVQEGWEWFLRDAVSGIADKQPLETRLGCRNGAVRQFQIHAAAIGEDHLVVLVDITALRDSEQRLLDVDGKLRQVASAFDSATEALVITDAATRIVSVNPAFEEITGYSQAEVIGSEFSLLSRRSLGNEAYEAMQACLREQNRWRGETWDRRSNGEDYPVWVTVAKVSDDTGSVTHCVVVFRDVSILRHSEAEVAFLAQHDRLTQLPNWVLLMDRLWQGLEHARETDGCLAALFIDLDRFKQVNDSLGHAIGDELLRAVAQRMARQLRLGDTLARVGSDEFVVLVEDRKDLTRVDDIVIKLGQAFAEPFVLEQQELFITASIGVSVHPTDGEDGGSLLKCADIAMRQAKARGRNTYQFYRPEMGSTAEVRLKIESALRGALQRGELHLHYQPQVDLRTGAVAGVEALLRWDHPALGRVSPALFIPIAEDLGVISEIGAWVLEQACQQIRAWDEEGIVVPRVAVNLSVRQLEPEKLVPLVERLCAESGLSGPRLELEITESMLMCESEEAISALARIRKLGVLVAVDDFGTGYSSLGYIQRLPLDRLKIDASFVRDIGQRSDDENIVRAIIGLGKSLGLEVIAEGIERREQLEFLQRAGCEIGQGFLFSKAVSAQDIAAFCRTPSRDSRSADG